MTIKIKEMKRDTDRAINYATCTYDDTGREIKVIVTSADYVELREKFGCDLETIARHTVAWAVKQGICEGDVDFKDGYTAVKKSLSNTKP